MQKLTLADIQFPAVYEEQRDEFRRHIIDVKRHRRIHVGPQVTLVFENRDTMRFQIQEMCRIEGIKDQDGIQAEVDVYNTLIPNEHELCASLFIEVAEEHKIKSVLDSFIGLDHGERVRLEFDGNAVPAVFEEGHSEEDRIAAVHYVWFRFSEGQSQAFSAAQDVSLIVDHPNYQKTATLTREQTAALASDLTASA